MPELRGANELRPGADDAGDPEQADTGCGEHDAAALRRFAEERDPEERADPRRRAEHMQRVGGDVQAVDTVIEGMPGERRCEWQCERRDERGTQEPALERRGARERPGEDRDERRRPEREPRARSETNTMRFLDAPDRGEHARAREDERHAFLVAWTHDEREHGDPDRNEQPGIEEPARDDVGRVGPGRLCDERRRRRRLAAADGERDDARLEVAVVGDDRPADRVRAAPKLLAHRDDEHVLRLDVRGAREDRGAPVPDGFDTRPDAHHVVEGHAHGTGCGRDHRAVRRRSLQKAGMRLCERRQRKRCGDRGEGCKADAHFRRYSRRGW